MFKNGVEKYLKMYDHVQVKTEKIQHEHNKYR